MIEALPHKVKKLRAEFVNPKYTVVECAASDRDGIVDFEMNEIDETSSLLKIRRELPELSAIKMGKATTLSVQARTLDGIAGEAGICEIDLLKIDVQGAELKVLAGAPMTLPRTRFVWMEVSFKPLYENSATFFEMYEQMQRHGFGLLDMTCAFRAPNKEMLQANGLFFRK